MNGEEQYPQHKAVNVQAVIEQHLESLTRFIDYRVANKDDSQDITAETVCQFLEYCRRAEQAIEQPRALLFTIAKRRLADYYGAQAKRAGEITIEDAPQIPATGSLAKHVEATRELERIRTVLKRMREEDREMIILSAIVGLTTAEMAELMQTSSGAIRVRLYAARKKLKKLLQENTD